jgi:hypothetical protein
VGGRVRVEPYSGLNFARNATTWTLYSPGEMQRCGTSYRLPPFRREIVESELERLSPK